MKLMMRILSLLMALMLPLTLALAETGEGAIAMVNGEPLLYSDYTAIESAYLYQYQLAGVDLTDPATYAYVQDLALTYAIRQMLLVQDMTAQGCFELSAEDETWCQEMGQLAWEKALDDVSEMIRTTLDLPEDEDMSDYALAYAADLGVSAETYMDEYRMQLALVNYYDWLIGGTPVTDADVQAAYEERVAASRALYGNDIAAFENAVSNGSEVWYMPAGYRSVLQILLPAEGTTSEERLASVQPAIDEINGRLAAGESFVSLIAAYGTDVNFANEAFYSTGYQVHQESVMWESDFIAAAFSAEMVAPGSVSQPFASDLGVHILYYLGDVPGGAVELTTEVYNALASVIYEARTQAALTERLEVLSDEAEVVLH